jgi:hypothetical protein
MISAAVRDIDTSFYFRIPRCACTDIVKPLMLASVFAIFGYPAFCSGVMTHVEAA